MGRKKGRTAAKIRLKLKGHTKFQKWLKALQALMDCQPELEIVATVKHGKYGASKP